MSEESQTSSLSEIDMGSLRGVVHESPNMLITTIKFNGTNYLTWSKSIIIHIQGRDKEEYLTGEAKKPSSEDPKYRK